MNSRLWAEDDNFKAVEKIRSAWKNLHDRKVELDYEIDQFSYNLRQEFAPGPDGDSDFVCWASSKLYGVGESRAEQLLAGAKAFKRLAPKSAKEYQETGGKKQARILNDLTAQQAQRVVSRAKGGGRTIREATIDLGLVPKPATVQHRSDVEVLAVYIHKNCTNLPSNIRSIVDKYR